jgi:hypothetical protein
MIFRAGLCSRIVVTRRSRQGRMNWRKVAGEISRLVLEA